MKRIPSNRMPKYVEPVVSVWRSVFVVIFFACFLVGMVWTVWSIPWFLVPITITGVWQWFEWRRQKRIAAERVGESICTFSRSFDCRSLDTWVVRAVHEQVQPLVEYPLRKSDRFATLGLNEDIGIIAEEVAQRTGRPLTSCEQNPWYGKVETVADLVEFFMCQPKQLKATN